MSVFIDMSHDMVMDVNKNAHSTQFIDFTMPNAYGIAASIAIGIGTSDANIN